MCGSLKYFSSVSRRAAARSTVGRSFRCSHRSGLQSVRRSALQLGRRRSGERPVRRRSVGRPERQRSEQREPERWHSVERELSMGKMSTISGRSQQ